MSHTLEDTKALCYQLRTLRSVREGAKHGKLAGLNVTETITGLELRIPLAQLFEVLDVQEETIMKQLDKRAEDLVYLRDHPDARAYAAPGHRA